MRQTHLPRIDAGLLGLIGMCTLVLVIAFGGAMSGGTRGRAEHDGARQIRAPGLRAVSEHARAHDYSQVAPPRDG